MDNGSTERRVPVPARRWALLVGAWCLAVAGHGIAGDTITMREVSVDGTAHRVALRVPEDYDPSRAWPLVVFLHGAGECGIDGVRQTTVGLGPALVARPGRWPCLVLMPQKPTESEEWEEHEELVLAAIADVQANWHIDPDRISLTGISQGGHGTWLIGARHPELFSCLAPVCGYGRARTVASRVAGLPVWAFHGLKDDVVDPADTIAIVQGIRQRRGSEASLGDDVRMTLYPAANHNSWDAAYAEPELPGWLLGHVRQEARP
ncbi:MAG: phospholipase [bacterium]|nr:phospholipase [bacterium]